MNDWNIIAVVLLSNCVLWLLNYIVLSSRAFSFISDQIPKLQRTVLFFKPYGGKKSIKMKTIFFHNIILIKTLSLTLPYIITSQTVCVNVAWNSNKQYVVGFRLIQLHVKFGTYNFIPMPNPRPEKGSLSLLCKLCHISAFAVSTRVPPCLYRLLSLLRYGINSRVWFSVVYT